MPFQIFLLNQFSLNGNFSEGLAVSGDGSFIVGYAGSGAFRLSQVHGLEILINIYADLLSPGSELYTATAISSDGRFIVGNGLNSATNRTEAFLLDTDSQTSIDNKSINLLDYTLNTNYPNPFNP